MRIDGGCHCGNITFKLEWRPDPLVIPARACTCAFCTKHGGDWTSCPGGSLALAIRDTKLAAIYTFGTNTADFHVCARCGVVPAVTSRIDNHLYAVVNVNTFEGAARALLQGSSVTFDGEDEAARLARRRRNWIPDVSLVGAGGQAP